MSSKFAAPFYYHAGRTGCVLIHGFTGTPFSLFELGRFLYARGMTVQGVLLPGHGTRCRDMIGIPFQTWIDACSEAVIGMEKSCDRIFIIGLSMGGTIGLHLAGEMSVNGCISISAPIDGACFKPPGFSMLNRWIRYWPKWRSLIKPYHPELGYRCYPLPAVREFLDLLSVTRSRLSRVQCPVLLMHSRYDERVPESHMAIIYQEIGSRIKQQVLMDSRKHALTLGNDKMTVFQSVAEFIGKQA
ncbi:alpha/beta fold hydrolase [bacterium]|nr:alpha/beta fold hydrolase [bacterium]